MPLQLCWKQGYTEDLREFDWNEMLEMLSENTNDDTKFKFTLSNSKTDKKK